MTYSIRPATTEDLQRVAENMDPADAAEVWASSHRTPASAVLVSSRVSRETLAGCVDDRAICVFGVGQRTLMDNRGIPWLLGTPEIKDHARAFLRASKRWVQAEAQRYEALENWVDARHTRAVQWLKWLGFELEEPRPFGVEQMPFHRFTMRA